MSAIRLASALVNPHASSSPSSSSSSAPQWKQPDDQTHSMASSGSYTALPTTTSVLSSNQASSSSSATVTAPYTPSDSSGDSLMWTYPIVNKSENPHQPFTLGPISLNIPTTNSGGLYVITGPVGSGKSSLLLALLGELKPITPPPSPNHHTHTSVDPSTTHYPAHTTTTTTSTTTVDTSRMYSYSYCPQVPCLHSGSVRENILMGRPYDEIR